MVSVIRFLVSASPSISLFLGFLLTLPDALGTRLDLAQTGWGLITAGILLQIILPLTRRYR